MTKRTVRLQCLGALLLCGAAAMGWTERSLFFASWLAAWWFFLGIVLGALANAWIHALTGGRWGDLLWPATDRLRRRMPWLLLLFLPLLAGLPRLYPWWGERSAWLAAIEEPHFASAWFSHGFFGLRLLVYAAAFGVLAAMPRVRRSAGAVLPLLAYMLLGSLASVDLLMSLVPGWTSSVFGWLALTGQMTGGAAASIALAARSGTPAPAPAPGRAPVWRDLGNLLLMWVLMQAYLQFMQFLIIWAENLPREISWYLPRMSGGWADVGIALAIVQFALPLAALLLRRMKDTPRQLGRVALALLLAQALGGAWMVLPSVQPEGLAAWWLLPLCFAGMGLLLFAPSFGPAVLHRPAAATPGWKEPLRG